MYSTSFSRHYDQLMGDYSSITRTTKQLASTYLPQNSHVLELGCGTGNILRDLSKSYTVSGLELAEGMLEQAKKKVPKAKLYQGDMTKFTLEEKFDGILCIFDTINHLTDFSQWEKLFLKVSKHLNPQGIFIFDMNTKKRLDRLSKLEPYVGKINKDTLTRVKFTKTKNDQYRISFQIFENIQSKKVGYIEEIVEETAFDTIRVQNSLQKYFSIEKKVDPIRKRITSNTGRIFFVCRKK